MIISGTNIVTEEKEPNRFRKPIIIGIVFLSILILIIIGLLIFLQMNSKDIQINNKAFNPSEGLFITDQATGKLYISIRDFAQYVGYEWYSGEYYPKIEDSTKCYVQSKNEVAVYSLNSNIIYKTPILNQPEYESFLIDEPVKTINNKLYTTIEGIKLGFNVKFDYNNEKGDIIIYTLDYLVSYYSDEVIRKGYSGISESFKNQKAILYDMIVVGKLPTTAVNDKDFRYGVMTTSGTEFIGTKYESIEFIETTKEFFVTSLQKVGIVTSNGETKVTPSYDELKLLDKNLNLYLAKANNKYGVLNNTGTIIIYLEYESIGVDVSLYPANNIKNPLFLYDNCIIAKQNNKYGIFDKTGELITELEFDGLGYIEGTSKNINLNNLLVIPRYEAIVVYKNKLEDTKSIKKYGLVNSIGTLIVPCEMDKIYSVTSGGQEEYYLEKNGNTMKLSDYLKARENGILNPLDSQNGMELQTQTEIDQEENQGEDQTQDQNQLQDEQVNNEQDQNNENQQDSQTQDNQDNNQDQNQDQTDDTQSQLPTSEYEDPTSVIRE